MNKIDKIKEMWSAIYDINQDTLSTIDKYFHKNYEQCINGVTMSRSEYINHVLAQKENLVIDSINYLQHLENGDELFAIYQPKGKNKFGSVILAEVISYFLFDDNKIKKIYGQVRLIEGNYSDVDMEK